MCYFEGFIAWLGSGYKTMALTTTEAADWFCTVITRVLGQAITSFYKITTVTCTCHVGTTIQAARELTHITQRTFITFTRVHPIHRRTFPKLTH